MDRDWDGEERREAKRRYTIDRRDVERKKKYWINLFLPIVVGVLVTSLMSWGVYITHTIYTISANYEQTFKKHMEDQSAEAVRDDIRMDAMQVDYNSKISRLHDDMMEGFKELRNSQNLIQKLIVSKDEKK